ncbi:hypothetical protein FI667_g9364, partial [Globisporangium splendens]
MLWANLKDEAASHCGGIAEQSRFFARNPPRGDPDASFHHPRSCAAALSDSAANSDLRCCRFLFDEYFDSGACTSTCLRPFSLEMLCIPRALSVYLATFTPPHPDAKAPRPAHHATVELVLSLEESEMLLSALRDGTCATSPDVNGHNACRGASSVSRSVRGTAALPNAETSMEVTNASVTPAPRSVGCSETESQHEQGAMVVKYHRKPSPNQQKQEVDLLRQKVKELEAKLEQLRLQRARVQPSRDHPATKKESQSINMWEQIAAFEKKAAYLVVQENTRLRAQYTFQREIVKRLDESRFQNQLAFEAVCTFPDGDLLPDMCMGSYDDDSAVFAALGRDFDVRFVQTKAVFDAMGLTGFGGEMQYVNRPRRSAKGILYFESLRSDIIPLELHIVERIVQNCMKSTDPSLRDALFSGKVSSTKSTVQTKTVDAIRVLESEAILTLRSSYKRHVGEHQVVVLWERDTVVSGPVLVRFREKGWSLLRHPTSHAPTGAATIE